MLGVYSIEQQQVWELRLASSLSFFSSRYNVNSNTSLHVGEDSEECFMRVWLGLRGEVAKFEVLYMNVCRSL